MYTTTRHISTKKLPTCASPRNARMIAVSPQNPIEADKKNWAETEEQLAEIGEMLIARIVLQVGVRHERDDGVKDRRRFEHPSFKRFIGIHG